jgi:hypothetical protein
MYGHPYVLGVSFFSWGNGSHRSGFEMKCDFCNRNKETIKTAIEYKGNDVFKFDSLVLTFDLCAQCVGENLSASNGFTKAGA